MSSASLLWFLLFFQNGAHAFQVYSLDLSATEKVEWIVVGDKRKVEFEVTLRNEGKYFWFGFGFSDRGNFKGADLCFFYVDHNFEIKFEDAWTDEEERVRADEEQNCEDASIEKLADDRIKFVFARKFNTCDPKDYVIEDGTTNVVWVKGYGKIDTVQGLNLNSNKWIQKGFKRTQVIRAKTESPEWPSDSWKLKLAVKEVPVPAEDTTYWCHVKKLPDKLNLKHHILGYEPYLINGSDEVVHHMEVFHCETAADEEVPFYAGPCFGKERPEKSKVCSKVIAAWAMGAGALSYPKEAGFPIGGPDYNRYVMLEVHYNNPKNIKGLVDNSGIILYLTRRLRRFDVGIMELGLEYTDKMAIPPAQSDFRLAGFCIPDCTKAALPVGGIRVFASELHTHLIGTKVFTRHVRGSVELPELNRDNHFSMDFQEIRLLKEEVHVLPGDALVTTCEYDSRGRENVTLGGFSTKDEMCVNYIFYYPKTDLEVCKSSLSYDYLFTYFDFLRKYENQKTDSKEPISKNYKAIDWTPLRVQVLNDLYMEGTLSMQCNRSNGERFPGDWEDKKTVTIKYPLIKTSECPEDDAIQ